MALHAAPLEFTLEGEIKLHIFVDAASVELFVNDGRARSPTRYSPIRRA
ncbi:GH32 C-terminal domain-containing protein [Chelativorans alearense]